MSLADLDELTLRCRSSKARDHIAEAVAAYSAGAFRSCIIATWHSVVFDFLDKLRELDLSGDNQAKAKLAKFEVIRSGGESKLKEALEFEREILTSAETEFELLSLPDRQDLDRLQYDRNRYAHPSMQSAEEVYQPSPELARTHIRNAVEHLLSREPVQGKAAFDRIVADVKSPYFPKSIPDAVKHFQAGPLKRARKPLIRSLTLGICKSLLKDNNPPDERSRQFAAVGAILAMHRADAEFVLKNDLLQVIASVAAEDLWKLIALFAEIPLIWDFVGAAVQALCERFIETVKDAAARPRAIAAALGVPALRSKALEKIPALTSSELADAIAEQPRMEFVSAAIPQIAEAGSFRAGEVVMGQLIMPLIPVFEASDIDKIIAAVADNGQVWDAGGVRPLMYQLFIATPQHRTANAASWQRFREKIQGTASYYWDYFSDLDSAMKEANL